MKAFNLNGDEFAQVVYLQSLNGPKAIDIGMETLSIAAAKRLGKWLKAAIKELEQDADERGIHLEQRGRKKTMVLTSKTFKKS